MKKAKKIMLMGAAVVVIACLGVLVVEWQTKVLHRLYDDAVLDNVNHYLPCEALPEAGEAETILAERQEDLERIKAVNPGLVGVELDTFTCPGRADLLIWYASHEDRVAIEALLGGETFFGIPVRLQNR